MNEKYMVDMNNCHLRVGNTLGVSEFLNGNPEAGGWNYQNFRLSGGLECQGILIDASLHLSYSDETNLGAGRKLGDLSLGYRFHAFWHLLNLFGLDWKFLKRFSLIPTVHGEVGHSTLNLGNGYIPIGGTDGLLGVGGRLAFTPIVKLGNAAFGLDAGMAGYYSLLRNYVETETFASFTVTFVPEEDDCDERLKDAQNVLENCRSALGRSREEVVIQATELKTLLQIIDDVAGHNSGIYDNVKELCSPTPPSVELSLDNVEIEDLPGWYRNGATCEDGIEEAQYALEMCQTLRQDYADLNKDIKQQQDRAQTALNDQLWWNPVCDTRPVHIINVDVAPYRLLLFPNNTSDIDLRPQTWASEPNLMSGGMIYSNPQLDELLIFLMKNPEYKIGIETFANDTGPENINKELADGRLEAICQYMTLDTSCKPEENQSCIEGPQKICGVHVSPIEQGKEYTDKHGSWYHLTKDRICWNKSHYTVPELLDAIKSKKIVLAAELPPERLKDITVSSPLFRSAIFTLTNIKEDCSPPE